MFSKKNQKTKIPQHAFSKGTYSKIFPLVTLGIPYSLWLDILGTLEQHICRALRGEIEGEEMADTEVL